MNRKTLIETAVLVLFLVGATVKVAPASQSLKALLNQVGASSDCAGLFSSGFFDETSEVSSDTIIQRIQQGVCQKDVTTIDKARSRLQKLDSSWDGIYGIFSESYGNTTADHDFSQWQHAFCADFAFDSAEHADYRKTVKTASPVLTAAYIACISQPGVHLVQAGASSAEGFKVVAKYQPMTGKNPYAFPQKGKQIYSFDNASCKAQRYDQLGPEGMTLQCTRNTAGKQSAVTINSDEGTTSLDVDVVAIVVPPPPAAAPTPQPCQPELSSDKKTVFAYIDVNHNKTNTNWVDTGIAIPPGTTAHIEATGSWQICNNPNPPYNCDTEFGPCGTDWAYLNTLGGNDWGRHHVFPDANSNFGALLARIGEGGSITAVCSSGTPAKIDMTSDANGGKLYLGINDAANAGPPYELGVFDNHGAMDVTINYTKKACP